MLYKVNSDQYDESAICGRCDLLDGSIDSISRAPRRTTRDPAGRTRDDPDFTRAAPHAAPGTPNCKIT